MSKRRKNKVGNQENVNVNVKEETKMEKTVETTEDIQNLTDEELGVEASDDAEYIIDENGEKIKIIYVEVEKPKESWFKRHKKGLTIAGIGTATAIVGGVATAIAYSIGKAAGTSVGEPIGENPVPKLNDNKDEFDDLLDDVTDVLESSGFDVTEF